MVRLDCLNGTCTIRQVANAIPAQIACRLFGNDRKPCFFDKLCVQTEKRGLWLFYSALISAAMAAFVVVFWLLRVTRLSKVLWFFLRLLIPPLSWMLRALISLKEFADSFDP